MIFKVNNLYILYAYELIEHDLALRKKKHLIRQDTIYFATITCGQNYSGQK